MIRIREIACYSAVLLLGACSSAQVASTQTILAAIPADLAAACATAQKASGIASAVVKGGAANTVASISQYVTAGCSTGEAIATLAADPTSTAWLNGLTASLTAATPAS
jgi:hypothetical protein